MVQVMAPHTFVVSVLEKYVIGSRFNTLEESYPNNMGVLGGEAVSFPLHYALGYYASKL